MGYPADFVFEGWVRMNGRWYALGATPGMRAINSNTPGFKPPLLPSGVEDKLNELEAEIVRLKGK